MKSYEKACPDCRGTGTPNSDEWCTTFAHCESSGGPCPTCHGAGVVSMTTDEMLEALLAEVYEITLSRYELEFYIPAPNRTGYEWKVVRIDVTTPVDALRAALEAVTP